MSHNHALTKQTQSQFTQQPINNTILQRIAYA